MKEKSPLYKRVVKLIQNIPSGKVATYSHIAGLAGAKGCARHVSYILSSSSKSQNLPWHRVINSQGKISLRVEQGYFDQINRLKKEGVNIVADKVYLETYLWQPTNKKLKSLLKDLPPHIPLSVR